MNEKFPERIIEEAVKGMLPKNKLGKSMIKKLKVFSGPEHDHESQQPIEWNPNMTTETHYATGRRKTSSARIYLTKRKRTI